MPERAQYQFDRESQRRVARDFLDQKAASSRPGQVYHTMTSLQDRMSRPGYDTNKADIDQLKGLRREWNREQKYTPQGMRVSGATSQLDAQKRFVDITRPFSQANPQAYGRMYPVASTAMKLGEYGGLLGLGIRGLTGQLGDYAKNILGKDGINAALNTNKAELENYANLTYGPHLEGIEELDLTREYEGPWPHEGLPIDDVPLLVDEEPGLTREKQEEIQTRASSDILDEAIESQWPTKDPVVFDDYVSDRLQNLDQERDDLIDEDTLAGPRFDDSAREQAIMDQYTYNAPAPLRTPSPQEDFARFNEYPTPDIGVEFGEQDELPPLPPYDDPRTESGIANLMPGGPLYDRIPMGQRLNMRIAEQMRERGPHYGERATSYFGSNWYDEYKRKMENEMEVNRGIRSPIDR